MNRLLLLGALGATSIFLAACTTTPTDPSLQTAGPKPSNVGSSVRSHLNENLKDPYSLRELSFTEVKHGGMWTGVINQGMVPSWYSCVRYNAKNSYGGYTGRKDYVFFIRNDKVVGTFDKKEDNGFSEHSCW